MYIGNAHAFCAANFVELIEPLSSIRNTYSRIRVLEQEVLVRRNSTIVASKGCTLIIITLLTWIMIAYSSGALKDILIVFSITHWLWRKWENRPLIQKNSCIAASPSGNIFHTKWTHSSPIRRYSCMRASVSSEDDIVIRGNVLHHEADHHLTSIFCLLLEEGYRKFHRKYSIHESYNGEKCVQT